jgi:lysine 6-dehydrogenase
MKKIIVLGAGLVGKAIAIDLSKSHEVTSIDLNANNLGKLKSYPAIKTREMDLSLQDSIREAISDCDLVIGALPSALGFPTLKTVIEAGKNIVDISFLSEDPFELDKLAKEKNVTAVVDCGVAPGMSNMILGYHNHEMKVERFDCMVGGLPANPDWPYRYKAPFSPMDVLEEYTRPARIVEGGNVVVKPALSELETVEFDQVGSLEAFNTDGLRTLLTTMKIPFMRERTLRYPGHAALMKILSETGFFRKETINIKGQKVAPIDMTSKLLFPKWKLAEDEEEFTVMRIEIEGLENGAKKKVVYNLLDRYDKATGTSSMARTTGYTCTATADLVLNGDYSREGISPPEYLGEDEKCFRMVIKYLAARGIEYKQVVQE